MCRAEVKQTKSHLPATKIQISFANRIKVFDLVELEKKRDRFNIHYAHSEDSDQPDLSLLYAHVLFSLVLSRHGWIKY